MVGLLVATIGACAGYLEAWPINPARDFGPRVFCFLNGWGAQAFPAPQNYWWVPIAGPLLGGVLGGAFYHVLVRPYLPAARGDGAPP
jgi:glycerol uptake facilitator protein